MVDINCIPFKDKLKIFLSTYYKIQGRTYSDEDFAESILTNRTRLYELYKDFETCPDNILFKVYYYLNQCVDLSLFSQSSYNSFLTSCHEDLIIEIVGEINRRVSNKNFEKSSKRGK